MIQTTKFKEENVIKTLTTLIGTIAPTSAFATADVPTGNDGIFVWIFLGFFAIIVVGQLIPAAMLIIGLVKGATAKAESKSEAK